MQGFFVTGTDTDIGKTIVSSWLTLHLDGCYWKPIQSGLEGVVDLDVVRHITGLSESRFFDSRYSLTQPLSPHEAARRDQVLIDINDFQLPQSEYPLIVEGAGGVMVPINATHFVRDLIAALNLPVILVARSELGTINHTLLSLKALREIGVTISGVVLSGKPHPHNRQAIEEFGDIKVIAEIPRLEEISKDTLLKIEPLVPISEWV